MAAEETEKICAECGHGIWEGWTSFRRDPENPEKLLMNFGGHIRGSSGFPRTSGCSFIPRAPPRSGRRKA